MLLATELEESRTGYFLHISSLQTTNKTAVFNAGNNSTLGPHYMAQVKIGTVSFVTLIMNLLLLTHVR